MEPMYNPVRDEVEPAWAAGATFRAQRRATPMPDVVYPAAPAEPPIPPAFAPGALDILRERVARMRATLPAGEPQPTSTVSAPAPQVPAAPVTTPMALTDELSTIRLVLTRLGGQSQAGQLEGALEALGRKIDLLNAKALDPVALRRLEIQTAELRGAVERALRLHEASDARADAVIVPFTQYAGAVRDATQATLHGQERVARELDGLRGRLHGLSDRIGTLPEEFSAALAEQVDLLLDRMDRPGIDATALSPLVDVIERHLVTLTERVLASQQRLERLDGIEMTLHRISDQMEDLQMASADVSAEALQAVALRLSARDDAPAVIGLKRGLAALEARQREFEARTEDFLTREVEFVRAAEMELQGLADLEMVRPPQDSAPRATTSLGTAPLGPSPDFGSFPLDLDRPIFDGALGDDHSVAARKARGDWLAAVERTELRPAPAANVNKSRRVLVLASRAAVLMAAVGLAGVTVLQIARPAASYARTTPGGVAVAALPMAGMPVKAADAASLPMPPVSDALRTAALAGDPQAAYEVGMRFADGRGVETNQAAAMKWFALAVSRGSVPAAYRLGTIYEYTDRNAVEARRLYVWAAERGNLRAMHNLGVLATEGAQGQADWAGALKWFRKAAEMGLADSQHNLGVIYARGLAGETNLAEAFKWFAVAAGQGDTASARKRDEVARRADEPSLNKARALAAAFVPGMSDAQANTVRAKPEWNGVPTAQAIAPHGLASQGLAPQGLAPQGLAPQGLAPQAAATPAPAPAAAPPAMAPQAAASPPAPAAPQAAAPKPAAPQAAAPQAAPARASGT
ncbi:sel1 repeat family protein [Aquabacter cavernae]|uniref:sel1 repeat family protein n=1 Tax=Aquabacter cavernae TaxID=2496029 RepID=UPI0013DEF9FF|nr:sel1 repeat family protein [Aquabacter cavernae]